VKTGLALLEPRISLRQGAGGSAMRALIEDVFLREAAEVAPGEIGPLAMDDGAALKVGDRWLIVTTDSHVVHPVFFPGGDIGRLLRAVLADIETPGRDLQQRRFCRQPPLAHERDLVVAALHGARDVLMQARELRLPVADLALDLVAHVEDARDGALQLRVLAHALADRALVEAVCGARELDLSMQRFV